VGSGGGRCHHEALRPPKGDAARCAEQPDRWLSTSTDAGKAISDSTGNGLLRPTLRGAPSPDGRWWDGLSLAGERVVIPNSVPGERRLDAPIAQEVLQNLVHRVGQRLVRVAEAHRHVPPELGVGDVDVGNL
jgi:hypothetical protein